MTYTRNRAIHLLEHAFHFKLPKDKLAVLNYNHKTGSEINSCAGAGKTTLILFDAFLNILTGTPPNAILDITFSKKAQLDIVHQYWSMVHKLQGMGISYNTYLRPKFSTFHALFYHLLKHFTAYRHAKVLTSYARFSFQLSTAIKYRPKGLSEKEELRKIFQKYNYLVNNNYTFDGLHMTSAYFKNVPKTDQASVDSTHRLISTSGDKQLSNYISIVNKYNLIKHNRNLIDFNDMKTKLLQLMQNKDNLQTVQSVMARYQFCYLDEFQDIDTLQWIIMHSILSPQALHHIMVIGDDDQSIYAFRGSNPKIIINFTKNYPSTKLFHLSTNYRTNGHVLNSVRPMIQSNKYRINKHLYAGQYRPGGTFEIIDSNYMSGGDALLRAVLIKYHELKKQNPMKKPDLAILCRFNTDRLVASDWLANHQVYIRENNVLQDNYIYKLFHDIIQSLSTNQKYPLFNCLRKIGFGSYQHHIYSLDKMFKNIGTVGSLGTLSNKLARMHITGLSRFMRLALSLDSKSRKRKIKEFRTIDQRIVDSLNAVKYGKAKGSVGYDCASDLTNDYFSYMTENHFLSKSTLYSIINYLSAELKQFKTCNQWLMNEQSKYEIARRINRSRSYHSPFTILTIHQSKGLQFKYMFLYNLTDRNLHDNEILIEKLFSPQCSRTEFTNVMINLPPKKAQQLDGDDDTYHHLCKALSRLQKVLPKVQAKLKKNNHPKHAKELSFSKTIKSLINNKCVLSDYTADKDPKTKKYPKLQAEFNVAYDSMLDTCDHVEEERRLLYVAITRAKSTAIFNYSSSHASPLLDELKIDPTKIYKVGKDKRLKPAIKSNKTKILRKLNQEELKIEKKKQQIMDS